MKEGRVPRAVIKAVPSSKSLQFDFCTVVVNQLAGQQRSARAGIRRRAVIFRIAPELSNRSLAKGSGHPRQLDTVRFLLFFLLLFFFFAHRSNGKSDPIKGEKVHTNNFFLLLLFPEEKSVKIILFNVNRIKRINNEFLEKGEESFSR